MKRKAIFKICFFTILGLILASALISVLEEGAFRINMGCSLNTGFRYKNAKDYTILTDETAIETEEIHTIDINWIGGEVNITTNINPLERDIIVSEESVNFEFEDSSDKYRLRYLVKNGTLIIQYSDSMFLINKKKTNKNLNITLPVNNYQTIKADAVNAKTSISTVLTEKIDCENVSGSIIISNSKATNIEIDSVSGDIIINNVDANNVEFDTVSSKITGENLRINDLEIDIVSGNIEMQFAKSPSKISVDAVSSEIELTLSDNPGFTAKIDSVSGMISTTFEATISKKKIVYGDGSYLYNFETISGDVIIKK